MSLAAALAAAPLAAEGPATATVLQPDPALGCSLEVAGNSTVGLLLRAHTWNDAGQDVPGATASWLVFDRSGQSIGGQAPAGDAAGKSLFAVSGLGDLPPGGGVGAILTAPGGGRCMAVLPDPLPRPTPPAGPPGPAPPTSSCTLDRAGAAGPPGGVPAAPYTLVMTCPASGAQPPTVRGTLIVTYDDGTIAFARLEGVDARGATLSATLTKIGAMPWEWDGGAPSYAH